LSWSPHAALDLSAHRLDRQAGSCCCELKADQGLRGGVIGEHGLGLVFALTTNIDDGGCR
jgi:hypothetical protein